MIFIQHERGFIVLNTALKHDAVNQASCFEAVFNTINPCPCWIKIISDNGGHYHNSELMAIISHWHDWYGVEVRGWIFLEPGEAKTTVDSHHATVCQLLFFKKLYFLLIIFW